MSVTVTLPDGTPLPEGTVVPTEMDKPAAGTPPVIVVTVPIGVVGVLPVAAVDRVKVPIPMALIFVPLAMVEPESNSPINSPAVLETDVTDVLPAVVIPVKVAVVARTWVTVGDMPMPVGAFVMVRVLGAAVTV